MRLRILALVIGAIALTLGAQAPRTQTGVPIDQGLVAQAASRGEVPVIVGLQMDFRPEGDLAGPSGIAMQRDAINRAMADVTSRVEAAGITVDRRFESIPFFTATVNAAQLAELASTPGVSSVEADTLSRPMLAQSVPLIGATTSHAAGFTGAGWRVAVLDTGVLSSHPFLAGKVVAEACFSHTIPAQFATSVCPGGAASSSAPGSGLNCSSAVAGCDHGTHVSGIVAGSAGVVGAPAGLLGVAPGAGIIAVQVFSRIDSAADCSPGPSPCALSYSSDQIAGMQHVLNLAGAANVNQVAAINMSLGGGLFTSTCDAASGNAAVKAAIDNLRSVGIASAIATGNGSSTTGISSPGCISTAISVGSTTKADAVSSFTNRKAGLVALMAPGSSITSSVPTTTAASGYASFNGTSMATPHVAGAWAVLKQAVPGASVSQVLAALQSTGVNINDSLTDLFSTQALYPRISVNAARLQLAGGGGGGTPGAPGTPVISGSGNAITISWAAPSTGGAPTSYTVIARLTCGGGIITTLPVGGLTSLSVTGPNGTFCVTVQASNGSGAGPESAGTTFSLPIVPAAPGAPTNFAASVNGTTANFSWTAPTTGGTVAEYVMTASQSPGGPLIATLLIPGSFNAAQVTGVPPGTYFVRLAARNLGGMSANSNQVTVTVAGPQPPQPPTLSPATVGGGRLVTLAWTPGGGGSATSYTVIARSSPSGVIIASLPTGGTTVSVTAPPGTYFVSVVASNGLGTSAESNQITVVVP